MGNSVIDVIMSRRSVREFKQEQVDESLLQEAILLNNRHVFRCLVQVIR